MYRFFKFLFYLTLIGFVFDFFLRIFSVPSFKESLKYQGPKATATLFTFAAICATIAMFDTSIAFTVGAILFIPTLIITVVFISKHTDKLEAEHLKK